METILNDTTTWGVNADKINRNNTFVFTPLKCSNPNIDISKYFKELILIGFDKTKEYCISSGYVRNPSISLQISEVLSDGTLSNSFVFYLADKASLVKDGAYFTATVGAKTVKWIPINTANLYEAISISDRYNTCRLDSKCIFENYIDYRDYINRTKVLIPDGSVTENKTIFFENIVGNNKFNYQDLDIQSQKYLLSNGGYGALESTITSFITGFIPIKAGQSLTINKTGVGGTYNCLYDSSKTFLSSIANPTSGSKQTVTATVDGYVRFTIVITLNQLLINAQVMVNDGIIALPFEAYSISTKLKSIYIPVSSGINDGAVTTSKIADGAVNEAKLGTTLIAQLYKPKLILPSKIYAVVGDTLQLFYKSFVQSLQNYFIAIECSKGRNYPRYFEYLPVTSDVGTSTMTITMLDLEGNILDTKILSLITKIAVNPSVVKNILHVGDSTMMGGQIPIELSRRLKGTIGIATSPVALALSNFNCVGRQKNASLTVGWEGTGGWTWSSYNGAGTPASRFSVNEITNLNIGDIYDIPRTVNTEGDPDNYWRFQIQEINVTGGIGEVRVMFYATPYHIDFASEPQSGTWTKFSGTGQSTVTYTVKTVENYQPFYNNTTNHVDFTSYVNIYCGGQLDYCFVKLSVNNLIGMTPWQDVTFIINEAKTFINNLHTEYPNCKILVDSGTFASQKGGIGDDYNASAVSGKYGTLGFNLKIFRMIQAYIDLCNDVSYSSFCDFIPSYMQFDADNAYPNFAKTLNTRSITTEQIDNNGVHPKDEAYWQITDALFRYLLNR